MSDKNTSSKIAAQAGRGLGDPKTKRSAKTVDASALSQAGTSKKTSAKTATIAAKQLTNPKTSRTDKAIAASVLSQKEKRKAPKTL